VRIGGLEGDWNLVRICRGLPIVVSGNRVAGRIVGSSVGSCKGFTLPKLLKLAPNRASAAGAVHFSVEPACSPLKAISAEASKAARIPGSFTSEQKTVTDRRTAARYDIWEREA